MRVLGALALAVTISASGGAAFAQQAEEGVQLRMPDPTARPQPTGLVPQLRLGVDTAADDAIDDALSDDEFLDDDDWGEDDWGEDDWGEGWDDEGAGDEALAEPDPLAEDALAAEGEEAHEAAHTEESHLPTATAGHEGSEHEEGAHGEGAHAEEFKPLELLASVVNFLIWFAIIIYLARKPLAEFLEGRRRAVEEGLVEAKQLQEAAEAKYDEYTARLEHLDDELVSLRGEMINTAETERDRIIGEAEARAERMRRDSRFVIDQQMKQLRTDLTREAIEAAVSAAENVLVEQVQASDQTRLAEEYLGSLDDSMKDDEVRA